MTGSHTLGGHSSAVFDVEFSPDGTQLATVSADETLKLWNLTTMTLHDTLKRGPGALMAVAFSPDGKLVAFGSANNVVELWTDFMEERK